MQHRTSLIVFFFALLLNLAGCGGDGDKTSSSEDEQEVLTAEDLLQGAPQSLARESIPEYYPDPALPSDYVVANAEGLVAGLRIHQSRLVVKVNEISTTVEINELLETIQARVAGTAGMGLLYVELINNPTQEDLVWAIATLEESPAVEIAVEDILAQNEEGGETSLVENERYDCGRPYQAAINSEWTGTYFGGKSGSDSEWSGTAPYGNWWIEFIRMPAAWNFNDAIKRRTLTEIPSPIDEPKPSSINIGVVDVGFLPHPDLPLSGGIHSAVDCHGNMVAGFIGAYHDKHSNEGGEKGIEGVHPFSQIVDSNLSLFMKAKLIAMMEALFPDDEPEINPGLIQILSSLTSMLDYYPNIKVVNVSLGLSGAWSKCLAANPATCIHPENDPNAKRVWEKYARLTLEAIKNHDVLIVTSSGNASNLTAGGHGPVEAKWSGSLEYLALQGIDLGAGNILKADNILVVEAVGWQDKGGRREPFSSTGGQLAAPGGCMTGTSLNNGYSTGKGTSFSSPIISGLAGYLWSINPELTVAEVKNAILSSANWPLNTVDYNPDDMSQVFKDDCGFVKEAHHGDEPAQPPIVDAFAAVMTLNGAVEMLVDTDDGTPDGVTVSGEGADTQLPGDGQIDMADFRAFRDAVAQLDGYNENFSLDQPNHIKRDNNRDGCVFDDENCSVSEGIWSRFDFNGDGRLSKTDTVGIWLPGDDRNLAQPQRTDLEILGHVWPDHGSSWEEDCANPDNLLTEGWCAADLSDLINSRDIFVDYSAFELEVNEEVTVFASVGNYYNTETFIVDDETGSQKVFTVPYDDECAVPVAVDTRSDCHDYWIYVIAKKDNVVRAGSQNLSGSGYVSYFHGLNPASDVVTTMYPDVVVSLDVQTGTAHETVMTATATYSDAVEIYNSESYGGTRRDHFRATNASCSGYSCVNVQEFTRTETGATYQFIPITTGAHSVDFEIYTPSCEDPGGICEVLPYLPGRYPMKIDFFVTDAVTPEPEPEPEPEPDPEPEPISPVPEIIPATAGWSTSDNVEFEKHEICDEAAGTYTIVTSGSRHKLPTKSDPSRVEGFSETSSYPITRCGSYQTCNNWNYWSAYMSPNIFQSGEQFYYTKSCSYSSNPAGSGSSLIVERITAVNGVRAICDDNFLGSPNQEACFEKMDNAWAGWHRNRAVGFDGAYIYLMPEGILRDFPPKP